MTPPDARLGLDEALELFQNPYRRRLLVTSLDHNPEDEADIPSDLATSDDEFDQPVIEMTHVYLPKLEELGVIDWNRDENVVTKGPAFEELRPLLELVHNHRDELPDGRL